jgi:hypothetical protein
MSRAVMQQALDVLQKGDVLSGFVAAQILSKELAKPKQVPLTEEQVFYLIEAHTKWMPAAGHWRLNEVEFARAIEAAQNITGDKSC